ncbi:hypothetical protein RA263_04445 [Pseudomonas syringae pv. tagetis]|uniref:Uncharacterized protein n=3 Tax=Pseudomonas syringae group TaxID=136849 RepID=A0A0Q0BB89_9PSED|nr:MULTISPECIES: hypothetical protein [Pseudomonas syringae group]KPX42782.1 Uncharacterized protein ALO68_00814 [Pseudomonas syringae pv. helianthi]KPY90249.1 Uncharacterized protein ALO44_02097 [Pseudomonas syringae pv. tagetis]RMR10554.1 hypothetical protein ALP93_03829 [Pseudomonas syringae pv. helianthi]RMV11862.1 hypothetical protein ALP17_04032 [Pseudomonas savastanoi]RMW19731.1 hypothetical protein ALO98_01318 [Pseudomonas syringae pv. tagetis]
MQDEGEPEVENPGEVIVRQVPGEVAVPGFIKEYSAYLSAEKKTDSAPVILTLLRLIGLLLLVVGGVFIIFGPGTVRINYLTGLTFLQFLQLYPGPIASVGVLVYGISNFLRSSGIEEQMIPEQFLTANYCLKLPEGIDDDKPLAITYVGNEVFRIEDTVEQA